MLDSGRGMEGLLLLVLVLLGGVVLYLALSQRQYQRIDYTYLITQEERERQVTARLEHLERLLAEFIEYENRRRAELDQLIAAARQSLAQQVGEAQQTIVRNVLGQPSEMDRLLLKHSGAQPAEATPPQPLPPTPVESPGEENPQLVNFLKGPRQQQIAEMLELGHTSHDVSRILGVSRHETELVASIIFRARPA